MESYFNNNIKTFKQGGETVINNGRMTITEVAHMLGVTTKTIMRWEKAGKVKRPKRDYRGWRVYTKEELESLKAFYQTLY